jgi:hypothetical protein
VSRNKLKQCSKCKQLKLRNEFFVCSRNKDGLAESCKSCRKKWNCTEKSKLTIKNDNKKFVTQYQKLLTILKINGCSICGYDKCISALEFHHVNPRDKKFRIIGIYTARKDFFDELNKTLLLCSNCHRELHEQEK